MRRRRGEGAPMSGGRGASWPARREHAVRGVAMSGSGAIGGSGGIGPARGGAGGGGAACGEGRRRMGMGRRGRAREGAAWRTSAVR